jgi:hypothetical protein
VEKNEQGAWRKVRGGKISLDKVENIYIINNAQVLLFEN